MHFETNWKSQYTFNLEISAKEGSEPFLKIQGCRIQSRKDGSGEFVSFPSTKKDDGTGYWNHAWANEAFSAAVLEKAKNSKPSGEAKKSKPTDDSEIPF